MDKEKLMIPRYLVINNYPGGNIPNGSVLQFDVECVVITMPDGQTDIQGSYPFRDISKYPHLFKPLRWDEMRDVSDMPEYVKVITPDLTGNNRPDFMKIKAWDNNENGYYGVPENFSASRMHISHFAPATLEEYQAYLNSKEQ